MDAICNAISRANVLCARLCVTTVKLISGSLKSFSVNFLIKMRFKQVSE